MADITMEKFKQEQKDLEDTITKIINKQIEMFIAKTGYCPAGIELHFQKGKGVGVYKVWDTVTYIPT